MARFYKILTLAVMLHSCLNAEAQTEKYTDKNRPYKFGFDIPGEQHRKEAKDENGIIMGEFGYLTADGIYHLTVFATDENGNYRILAMKNTRVGPSPWGARTKAPPTTTTTTTTTTTPAPYVDEFILKGKPGCSGCLIPTPPPPGSPPEKPLRVPNIGSRFPLSGRPGTPPQNTGVTSPQQSLPGGKPGTPGGKPLNPGSAIQSGGKPFPPRGQFQEKPDPAFGTGKPIPLNPDQYPRPSPGQTSSNGPPPGVNEEDVLGLLYKFNYTVGFHGHHETGFKNGAKEGEYFVHGRDGTARRVTYTADKDGFKPRISTVKIEKNEDIPRVETEKEYGLKGYEFKWFNRR